MPYMEVRPIFPAKLGIADGSFLDFMLSRAEETIEKIPRNGYLLIWKENK